MKNRGPQKGWLPREVPPLPAGQVLISEQVRVPHFLWLGVGGQSSCSVCVYGAGAALQVMVVKKFPWRLGSREFWKLQVLETFLEASRPLGAQRFDFLLV